MSKLKVFRWTRDLADLDPPVEVVLTEVDERGRVVREIGFDATGSIEYVKPSEDPRWGRDGMFYLIDLPPPAEEVDPDEFERMWGATGK